MEEQSPSTNELRKAIRNVVSANQGEPVGLKSLMAALESQFGMGKGALAPRKAELRELLVGVMEESEDHSSSSEDEVMPSRSRGVCARDDALAAAPSAIEDEEGSDKTAGKSRAGQTPDHQGFLKKRGDQGRLKLWRKRHFRLYRNEGVIAYFKSDKDTEQLGEVSVVGAFLIEKREDLGKFAFTITMKTTARVWVLQAPDEATMNSWISQCQPLMKETGPVRTAGDKKPPKPANGLPLPFPPTYVQGFAEREQSKSRLQDGELDWTKLSHVPAVKPATLKAGMVSVSLHGSKTAVIEEVREVSLSDKKETYIEDVPKQLKYSANSVHWSAADSQLVQARFEADEKTQRDLLKKLVGKKITASVPGTALGFDEDAGKRQETRLKEGLPDAPGAPAEKNGSLAFPNDATFQGKLYYDQQDDRYALVAEDSNTVHFLNTRDARTIKLADANVGKLNHGTDATFIAPRLWARFQSGGAKSTGLLTYRVNDAFEFFTTYVLLLSADEQSADVEGWFSVHNKTSKTFTDAKLVVSPDPAEEAAAEEEELDMSPEAVAKREAEKAGTNAVAGKLGGGLMSVGAAFLKKDEVEEKPAAAKVYRYPVQESVTLPAYDWAHTAFVSQKVPTRTQHLVTFDTPPYTIKPVTAKEVGADACGAAHTAVRFTNPLKELALPGGKAQVNRIDRSGFGAEKVADVAVARVEGGEVVTLNLEELEGVSVTRVQTGFNFDFEKHFIIETFEITVSNGRLETINITVEESLYRWSTWEIPASKPQHHSTDHPRKIAWDLRLNHGEYQTIKYTAFYQDFDLESDYAE